MTGGLKVFRAQTCPSLSRVVLPDPMTRGHEGKKRWSL